MFSFHKPKKGFTVWLTGLRGSGKTTIAAALYRELASRGVVSHHFDYEAMRKALSPDLGYSREDRELHHRRVVLLASSILREGTPVITSLDSPYRSLRQAAREKLAPFIEVHLKCPLSVCEGRDVRGLYKAAREGRLDNFTGIGVEYEEPEAPELVLDTSVCGVRECVERILERINVTQRGPA